MSHLLSETRIVLIHPTLPENVGAVARAMRAFGLRDLVIAQGGVDARHPVAVRVAAGAEAILEEARTVGSLEEALEHVVLAIGTTARPYDSVDLRTQEPRALATLARDYAQVGAIAVVFGTEKHGMTNGALKRCHQVARIPSEEGTCLNLAMAMNIFGYEWYLADQEAAHHHDTPLLAAAASEADLDRLGSWLTEGLLKAGVFRAHDAESKAHTVRRILSRARLDENEAALVRAIARRLPELLESKTS